MTGNGDHILPVEDKSIVALFLFFFLSVFGQKKKKKKWVHDIWKRKNILALALRENPWNTLRQILFKRKHSCPELQIAWLFTWHFYRTPPTTLWNQKKFSLIWGAVQGTWIWAPVSQHHPRKDWAERGVTTKVQSGERGCAMGSNRCDLQMVRQQSQVARVTYK